MAKIPALQKLTHIYASRHRKKMHKGELYRFYLKKSQLCSKMKLNYVGGGVVVFCVNVLCSVLTIVKIVFCVNEKKQTVCSASFSFLPSPQVEWCHIPVSMCASKTDT